MDDFVLHSSWFFGLICVSGVAGAVGSFLVFVALDWLVRAKSPIVCREFVFSGLLTGIAERFFFTLAIGLFGAGGIAPAAVGWVAIKGQVHYKIFSEAGTADLSRAYLGLMASLASLSFALVGGYAWAQHVTVARLIAFLAGGV
ncbi:hypothetical protein G3580_00705 [Nitrogeniibacter mangrovi]|uniref:Uncharacterized protein n=1 Tax=Nitrogeniibacter mangrovi TaxID=2016596 RepID=A0A6C1AY34_9RHOO|nr:hypothetical protein [Nitrogeniibacter mangrovi]QID16271.1 hypothetical protein G3580_00705 [Nitrogeniibacter mangrovi]